MKTLNYSFLILLLFTGETMADSKDLISQLEAVKTLISEKLAANEQDTKLFTEIEKKISANIPAEIKSIIANVEMLPKDYDNFFLGYAALNSTTLADQYRKVDQKYGFFGAYSADAQFNVSDDEKILLYDDAEKKLVEPVGITNLSGLLPVFSTQGDYIVANLAQGKVGELIAIVDGYDAGVLAPSIMEHIDDLLIGLKSGRYPIIDAELTYPTSWYERQKIHAGKLKIDEDGELVESNSN